MRVKAQALALGFDAVGAASASSLEEEGIKLRAWCARGLNAGMEWMNNASVREDPANLLSGARSVVSVGLDCRPRESPSVPPPGHGRLAAFARSRDYHSEIRDRLARLLEFVRALVSCRAAIAVDSRPLLERAFAVRAGMGWTGGSGCLVSPDFGPWLLLGELILDVTLEYDCPVPSRCGDCGRCASACPTGAIVEPGLIDANRCVAYLTIEHRGAIPRPLRPLVGDRIFGCDSCQECCAWPSVGSSNVRDAERIASDSPRDCEVRLPACYPAERLLVMTPAEFAAAFAGTPVLRASRARMARNAAVVLGNAPGPSSVAALGTALRDPEPLVRSHAAWALGRLNARGALSRRLGREPDRGVKAEIKLALRGGGRKTS